MGTDSQRAKVLRYLKGGGSLTAKDTRKKFGCDRLSARICELRKAGHNISMVKVEVEAGKRVGRYTLIPPAKPRNA